MGIQAEEYRPSAVLEHELGAIIGDATTPVKDDPAETSLLLRVATTMRWRQDAKTVLGLEQVSPRFLSLFSIFC